MVTLLGLGLLNCAGWKLQYALCLPENWRETIRAHRAAQPYHLLFAVEKDEVKRILHPKRVDGLGGENEKPTTLLETSRSQKTDHPQPRAICNPDSGSQTGVLGYIKYAEKH